MLFCSRMPPPTRVVLLVHRLKYLQGLLLMTRTSSATCAAFLARAVALPPSRSSIKSNHFFVSCSKKGYQQRLLFFLPDRYAQEIVTRIEADADLEFECIWKEHERTGMPRFRLTDIVSEKINDLNDFINKSPLWVTASFLCICNFFSFFSTLLAGQC